MIKTAAIALLLAGALTVQVAAKGRKSEKPMEWKGQHGPLEEGVELASDADAWASLWMKLGQDAPALDFKKFFAVAVFAGERPTGGWAVEFLEPVTKGADQTVLYRIKAPSGFSTQVISHPWKVRAFPRVKGAVRIEAVPPEAKPK